MRIRTAMATAALPCLLLALGACGGEAAVQPDDQYTRQLEGHGVVPAPAGATRRPSRLVW